MKSALLEYLAESGEKILSYYKENPPFALTPAELLEGTFVYFERGGKRLRPAICRLAAGALGGKEAEEAAIPCALALELYHNWTLIHDDMIDHDDTRRGKKAVHKLVSDLFSEKVKEETGIPDMKVVVTGGLGRTVADEIETNSIYDGTLTLDGLRFVYEKNRR